jgi:hypothetical protein
LFETINQALNLIALPIEVVVKRAGTMLPLFAGNREADAMAPQEPSNRPAAIGLIANEPPRALLRAPRPWAFHCTLSHQGDQDFCLMALSRREQEGDWLAVAFGPQMDFGTETALAAP